MKKALLWGKLKLNEMWNPRRDEKAIWTQIPSKFHQ